MSMGSEHSSQTNFIPRQSCTAQLDEQINDKVQFSLNKDDGNIETSSGRKGSISPGPSVSSDIDLPYISYTVNRPIGDSPKLTNKQYISKYRQRRTIRQKEKNAGNIIVVRDVDTSEKYMANKDQDILRLEGIPMFLPIMRATINLPAARDPEVLERLDPSPIRKLCLRYQQHLTKGANIIATEQNQLMQKIREVDAILVRTISFAMEKQKKNFKYNEKIFIIHELSQQLTRCHILLNHTLESMEMLNSYLNIDDRLEPFVWTTG